MTHIDEGERAPADLFGEYARLWAIARDGGKVWVRYRGIAERGEAGYFQHDGRGGFKKPEIVIIRPYYLEPSDEPSSARSDGAAVDLVAELITLAHEYGHYLSWRGKTPREEWRAYHAAVLRRDQIVASVGDGFDATHRATIAAGLSDAEKEMIVAEEVLAWKLGRELVPTYVTSEFDLKAKRGVHLHRYRLGLDELCRDDRCDSALVPAKGAE